MNFNNKNSFIISEFARKQLEKYGWSEGKGLGKEENGITKPVKISVKIDNQGIGHNNLDALTSMWWSDAFNAASKRIKVIETKTGVCLKSEKSQRNKPKSASLRHSKKKFVAAGIMIDKKEIFSVTANTLVPKFSSSTISQLKYDKLKKSKLKRRHIRLLEQDALYSQDIKKILIK